MKNLFKYSILSAGIYLGALTSCQSNSTVNNALDSLDSVGENKFDTIRNKVEERIDTIDSSARATIDDIKK